MCNVTNLIIVWFYKEYIFGKGKGQLNVIICRFSKGQKVLYTYEQNLL